MRLHEISEGLEDPKDNPCWKGYHPVGTKKKNGKTVPNCVPKESVGESSDKLPGTPVVSLSDFDDKDHKKNKYGQTVPKKLKKDDPRVKFHKDQKQGVAEGVDPATYPARAKEAHEKYLKYENLVDQELRKFGQRLPKAWDAARMMTKLSSDPKYALALKYYKLSEKFASLTIWYEDLAKKRQGVAEGSDAEAYKEKLLATLPQMLQFYEKNVKGWKPSEEQMLAAVETGYTVMKHTGDVKQAGKAVMDELNTLHRMSQGQQGVAEAAGLYGPFTVTINTGERPQSRTKTKKFRREDDAILWAQDWLEDFSQYPFATAEVTDPDGNVVWTTDEEDSPWAPAKQGVAEGFKNTYDKGDRVNTPLGTGTIVAVSSNVNVDGKVKVKLDDPSKAGEDGKYKDTFVLNTMQLTHLSEQSVTEKAPEGWEGTVKAMKKHKDEIDNPWALAWYMKNKGYTSHKK